MLVSSGAIGVGMRRMELPAKPKSLSGRQVCRLALSLQDGGVEQKRIYSDYAYVLQALAAIGQGRLIALWDNLFSQLGQPIAQVLLTRGDISDV